MGHNYRFSNGNDRYLDVEPSYAMLGCRAKLQEQRNWFCGFESQSQHIGQVRIL